MPGLSGTRLGAKWWGDVKAMSGFNLPGAPALTPAQDAAGLNFWTTLANDLVSEIQTNALVNPGSLAITPSNILDGTSHAACSGNGSVTTGTGTIT